MRRASLSEIFGGTMKFVTLSFALLVSLPVFAAQSAVYCKSAGKIYNASSETGHDECSSALMQGDACFTGSREGVIRLINGNSFSWDEEWLEGAHFRGKDSISYLFVDGPNELKEKRSMDRCEDDFFRR
jgi:hypothetical protein